MIDEAQVYEGKVTRKYMEKYGYNNVRGGDLTGDEEYIVRFGNFWSKERWETLTAVALLQMIILVLLIDKYHWSMWLLGLFVFAMCIYIAVMLRKK